MDNGLQPTASLFVLKDDRRKRLSVQRTVRFENVFAKGLYHCCETGGARRDHAARHLIGPCYRDTDISPKRSHGRLTGSDVPGQSHRYDVADCGGIQDKPLDHQKHRDEDSAPERRPPQSHRTNSDLPATGSGVGDSPSDEAPPCDPEEVEGQEVPVLDPCGPGDERHKGTYERNHSSQTH